MGYFPNHATDRRRILERHCFMHLGQAQPLQRSLLRLGAMNPTPYQLHLNFFFFHIEFLKSKSGPWCLILFQIPRKMLGGAAAILPAHHFFPHLPINR